MPRAVRCAGQLVQHYALVEFRPGDVGKNVGINLLAARKVPLHGALIDPKSVAGLLGI